jgi:hypothetical protein
MTWAELYKVVLRFGSWLVQPEQTIPPVPQHAAWGEPTYDEEAWADDWLRRFFAKPVLNPPPTPRQRYVLVPRFRYAAIEASIYAKAIGGERVPDPAAKWEELMIGNWHAKGRRQWLDAPKQPEDDQGSLQA